MRRGAPVAASPARRTRAAAARRAPARPGVFSLQHAAGNRAVASLLRDGGPVLRRACACGGRCADCREREEEQELLRRAPAGAGASGGSVPAAVRDYLVGSRGAGRPLAPDVRAALERSFGSGLGQVRVHTGPGATWAARSLRARAFALGKDIWFGAGEYRPDDPAGRRLLAHEVAHTVEQRSPSPLDGVRLGATGDPAEARAERAADAVARERPAEPSAPSAPVLRRYSIERVQRREEDGEPVVDVDLDNGIRYRVRRVCNVIRHERTAVGFRPPEVQAGADRENVWVELSWCQGTRGQVTAGADIPEQLQEAVRRVIDGALSGRSPDDVLRETTITPFVDFAIAQSGGLSVEGRVQVTVGGEGVQSGEGRITFRHGPLDVGVTGRGGGGSGFQALLTLTFTPGRESGRFDCPTTSRRRERLTRRCVFACTHGPIRPPSPPPRPQPTTEQERATVYFEYASSSRNARLNDPEAARLRTLLLQDYRVQAIRGYASPEGPLERRTAGFQGNRPLSRERAQAALAEVERLCDEAGVEGSCLVSADAPVAGCGERLGGAPECGSPEEGQERSERQGRVVAAEAVREFVADPAELARLTPEDRERLGRARTDDEKAQVVYPYLRRASLDLVRTAPAPPPEPRVIGVPRLPADYFHCPQDVVDAARPHLERRR